MMNRTTRTKAPVDAIDLEITKATDRVETLCRKMAENPTDPTTLSELIEATMEKGDLIYKRKRIITEYFNGPALG